MYKCKIYTLEDGIKYEEVETITYKNDKYILLCEKDSLTNICIRRLSNENNEIYLNRVNEDEFDDLMNEFALKMKNFFE